MQMAGDVVCGTMVKNMIESLKSVISEHDEVIAAYLYGSAVQRGCRYAGG